MPGNWWDNDDEVIGGVPQGDPIVKAADPYQSEDQGFQREASNIARENADRAAREEQRRRELDEREARRQAAQDKRDQAKFEAEFSPDGTPKAQAQRAAGLRALKQQIDRVQTLYNSNIGPEPLGPISSALDYAPTPANRQFDTAGASLSQQGLAAFRVPGTGTVSDRDAIMFDRANLPSSDTMDLAIEEQLRGMRGRVEEEYKSLGLGKPKWEGLDDDDLASPLPNDLISEGKAAMNGGGGNGGGSGGPGSPPSPPPFSDGNPAYQTATGDYRAVSVPEVEARISSMMRSGASLGDVQRYAASQGMEPIDPAEYQAVRKWLAANPNDKRSLVNATRYEPLTATEKAITAVGDNALGAGLIGAGQALSGNTLDELAAATGQGENARIAMGIAEARNPTATAVGEVAGSTIAGLTGEIGLARAGIGSGLARGLTTDLVVGAASGAGDAQSGDRGAGALRGAASNAAGGLAGTAATKGISRALSPSGGSMTPLYEAGVRPTPGQRLANANGGRGLSGMVGRTVSNAEEALQSVPIVGSAIRGAREDARDQFQVGAFNEALKEIGEQLPKGAKPSNEPHKFAQEAFNRVYDRARSGMRMVADEELKNDLAGMADDIGSLSPDAQNRLKRIMANRVNNRLVDGEATGAGYKRMISGLDQQIASLKKDPQNAELTDIVTNVKYAIENAARRYSDPSAVELLDAADAGYAKFVRIEDAAARRGGDSGTFTPTQFDSAVQRASGGVRSKAYLRGDALMQDYANAGKGLVDRMPNSGTTDRSLAVGGLAAGAASYVSPSVAAVLGAIGAAYAPGVRKATAGAFAPGGVRRKMISRQLEKRAQLIGRSSAAIAGVSSQE